MMSGMYSFCLQVKANLMFDLWVPSLLPRLKATSPQMIENGKKWVKKLEDKVNLEMLDIQGSRCVCMCVCVR